MKAEEALELLAKASAQYRGTREEHQMLLEAINVLNDKIISAKTMAKPAKPTVKSAK